MTLANAHDKSGHANGRRKNGILIQSLHTDHGGHTRQQSTLPAGLFNESPHQSDGEHHQSGAERISAHRIAITDHDPLIDAASDSAISGGPLPIIRRRPKMPLVKTSRRTIPNPQACVGMRQTKSRPSADHQQRNHDRTMDHASFPEMICFHVGKLRCVAHLITPESTGVPPK